MLAGGPPCQPFSKAGRSGMRYLVRAGLREPHDRRRDLWRSFLEVVRLAEPRAVIMENVPDMALDREMFILRSVVFELERLGYSVQERVLEAWRFGVPQFRQRLILVAVREGILPGLLTCLGRSRWRMRSQTCLGLRAAGDLPAALQVGPNMTVRALRISAKCERPFPALTTQSLRPDHEAGQR